MLFILFQEYKLHMSFHYEKIKINTYTQKKEGYCQGGYIKIYRK